MVLTFEYIMSREHNAQISKWTSSKAKVYAFSYPHLPMVITFNQDYTFTPEGEYDYMRYELSMGMCLSDDYQECVDFYNRLVNKEIRMLEKKLKIAKTRYISKL